MKRISVIFPTSSTVLSSRSESSINKLNESRSWLEKKGIALNITIVRNCVDEDISTSSCLGLLDPRFSCVVEHRPGLHNARHRGILENLNSDYYAFIDDDILIGDNYCEGLAELSQYHFSIATGPITPDWESAPPEWLCNLYLQAKPWPNIPLLAISEPPNDSRYIDPMYAWGANFIVSRQLLSIASGFHPDAFTGDLVVYRGDGETHVARQLKGLGGFALCLPKLAVSHRVGLDRMSSEYFYSRSAKEGVTRSYSEIRNGVFNPSDAAKKFETESFDRLIRAQIDGLGLGKGEWSRELEVLSITSGYMWHQQMAAVSPDVVNWCRVQDYFFASFNRPL